MASPGINRRTATLLGLRAAVLAAALSGSGARSWAQSSEAAALHVLNRLAFGPAPGDLARVQQMGIDRYIDEQLHPERLPLPSALQQQLDGLETTHRSQRELVAQYRAAAAQGADEPEEAKAQRRQAVQRVALEAGQARLLQALQSPRQLHEVMVDFWFNHFNVFAGKGLDRVLVENYEREAIRPQALGRFRDLLGATARHPAMLFYLDNWLSAAPGFTPPRGAGPLAKSTGLNENYARELMELHTLGVDGGYTQADVTELARMLTGWTLSPRGGGASLYAFDARRHDNGTKQWLGRSVAPSGQAEGEFALDVLAAHPATARHIAFKLAQAFVADSPPPALVDRLAQRYTQTDGQIAAVLKTLFDSPEFRDPAVAGGKFKPPYRALVSSVRAAGTPVTQVRPLLAGLYQLGQPLYGCPTPDGYKNTEAAWLNPDGVTRRVAFATALASGRLPFARPEEAEGTAGMRPLALARHSEMGAGARVNAAWSTPPVDAAALLATLGPAISVRTRQAVAQAEPALQAALVLGSPDFMRH